MSDSTADWVAQKLAENNCLTILGRTPEDYLMVKGRSSTVFPVAALGMRSLIERSHIEPLFSAKLAPKLIINVPTATPWSGSAIDFAHANGAAFGALGDVARAAAMENPGSFRNKSMAFFIESMSQHGNVARVSYILDSKFRVELREGSEFAIAVIEAYNMSAEDVRNAWRRVGPFDVVVKSTSYGSVSEQAASAARTMGARALMFGELMSWLRKQN